MVLLPGCVCCGDRCNACADGASQIVIDYTTGDGGGVIIDGNPEADPPGEYTIECEQTDYSVVIDIPSNCFGTSQQEYCLGTVSLDGEQRASNCLYWGGNERESYGFSYDLAAAGKSGSLVGGETYRIFPEEAAFTSHTLRWSGVPRTEGFSTYGYPFFSIIRQWLKQFVRVFRFRSRKPPQVLLQWQIGPGYEETQYRTWHGAGAEFSVQLKQKADGLDQPYWEVTGVSLVNGGQNYHPMYIGVSASVVNGTGALPRFTVSQMSFTAPVVTARCIAQAGQTWVPTDEATFAVTIAQSGTHSVSGQSVPVYRVTNATVLNGGSGYPQDRQFLLTFAALPGYIDDQPTEFTVYTNFNGQVASVSKNNWGRTGIIYPSASATNVTFTDFGNPAANNVVVGLTGVLVTRTRSQPTLAADPPENVTGMELSVTLGQEGTGNTAYWYVDAVNVIAAGSGWQNEDPITFRMLPANDPENVAAVDAEVVLSVDRVAPALTATTNGGTGAEFTVVTEPRGTVPETWSVTSVTFTGTTSGYADYQAIQFTAGTNVVTEEQAAAVIRTGRECPTVTVSASGGSGAVLQANTQQTYDWWEYPKPAWTVQSVTASSGGTGYSPGDQVSLSTDGYSIGWFYAEVGEVDEDGAILSVYIYDGGLFYRSNGQIESVEMQAGGSYYGNSLVGPEIRYRGKYYRQQFTDTTTPLPPLQCKSYPSGWEETVKESPVAKDPSDPTLALYPRVGDKYQFKDVFILVSGDVYDFPEVGHIATRRCEAPEMTITFQ